MEWSDRIGRRLKFSDLHILLAVVQHGDISKNSRSSCKFVIWWCRELCPAATVKLVSSWQILLQNDFAHPSEQH
jgi:hypothetical protein